MIRIIRENEPPAMSVAREWRVARALIAWRTRHLMPAITGYGTGREQIWRQQHHKCAWCEAAFLRKHAHLDHYRPKDIYWWLAWSWDNLLQTCSTCNTVKRQTFDLRDPTGRLAVGETPPETGGAKLVDPGSEDPRRHIRFALKPDPETPGSERWEPVALTAEGIHTIDTLGLHDDLLDNYQIFADHILRPDGYLTKIRTSIKHDQDVREDWRRTVTDLLARHQPYHSLAHDVLVWFREEIRATHGVELPPVPPLDPGPPAPPPIPLFTPDPTLDGWPELTRLYIRLARSGHATADERRAALTHVLDRGPLAIDALAALFGKTASTINKWLRDLLPDRIHRQRRRGAASLISLVPQPSGSYVNGYWLPDLSNL